MHRQPGHPRYRGDTIQGRRRFPDEQGAVDGAATGNTAGLPGTDRLPQSETHRSTDPAGTPETF